MKNKLVLFIFLILIALCTHNVTAFAASDIKVVLNGQRLEFDVNPIITNGRTMVPFAKIFQSLGADIRWDKDTNSAIGVKNGKTMILQPGSKVASVSGKKVMLEVPARAVNGRLLVPLAFVAQNLEAGTYVGWDKSTGTVVITTKAARMPDAFTVDKDEDYTRVEAVLRSAETDGLRRVVVMTKAGKQGYYEKLKQMIDSCRKDYKNPAEVLNVGMSGMGPGGDIELFYIYYGYPKSNDPGDIIKFADKHVEDAVRKAIAKPEGDIHEEDVLKLTFLQLDAGTGNLSGMEYLTGLSHLNIPGSTVTDLTPIKGLKTLCDLILYSKDLTDISPLAELPNLVSVTVGQAKVTDVSPLSKCRRLSKAVLPLIYYVQDEPAGQSIKRFSDLMLKARDVSTAIFSANMSDTEKVKAAHDYIINNTRYDVEGFNADKIPDSSYSPEGVFFNGVAVCQGYADAFKLLMDMEGIECYVVLGDANSSGTWGDHAWNIVKVNGRYSHVDATWDDPVVVGGGGPVLRYDYFMISDTAMRKDHTWDTKQYPVCE